MRGQRNGIQILRAVAARERPVVLFLDDVQWASDTPLAFLDMILDQEPVEGLLVVCTYREHAGAGPDPLTARLPRWWQRTGVRHLRLDDLALPGLTAMVADVLGVAPRTAAPLAEQLHPSTSGNPYVTMELLGALVREGVLAPTEDGWQWDRDAVHERLDRAEVEALLIARVADAPTGDPAGGGDDGLPGRPGGGGRAGHGHRPVTRGSRGGTRAGPRRRRPGRGARSSGDHPVPARPHPGRGARRDGPRVTA